MAPLKQHMSACLNRLTSWHETAKHVDDFIALKLAMTVLIKISMGESQKMIADSYVRMVRTGQFCDCWQRPLHGQPRSDGYILEGGRLLNVNSACSTSLPIPGLYCDTLFPRTNPNVHQRSTRLARLRRSLDLVAILQSSPSPCETQEVAEPQISPLHP